MKNYKIIYDRPVIQHEESKGLEDFNELLTKYRKPGRTNWRNIFKNTVVFLGISAIIFFGIYKDSYEFEFSVMNPKSDIAIDQPSQPSLIKESDAKANAILEANEELKEEGTGRTKEIAPKAEPSYRTQEKDNSTTTKDQVGGFIEAEPIDGFPELYSYLEEQLIYPDAALQDGVEGNVIVKFTIDTSGSPIKIRVEKSLHEVLDSAAIKLIANMPDWRPAQLNGEVIESNHRIPLFFQIEPYVEEK